MPEAPGFSLAQSQLLTNGQIFKEEKFQNVVSQGTQHCKYTKPHQTTQIFM